MKNEWHLTTESHALEAFLEPCSVFTCSCMWFSCQTSISVLVSSTSLQHVVTAMIPHFTPFTCGSALVLCPVYPWGTLKHILIVYLYNWWIKTTFCWILYWKERKASFCQTNWCTKKQTAGLNFTIQKQSSFGPAWLIWHFKVEIFYSALVTQHKVWLIGVTHDPKVRPSNPQRPTNKPLGYYPKGARHWTFVPPGRRKGTTTFLKGDCTEKHRKPFVQFGRYI